MTTSNVMILMCLFAAACGDNVMPPPDLEALPSCTELGCDSTAIDRTCAATGSCTCAVVRTKGVPPVACAADCVHLPCDEIVCGLGVDEAACTCAIGESFVGCRG